MEIEEASGAGIRIWPNPVPDKGFNVLVPEEMGKCQITITDLAGSVIYKKYLYPGQNRVNTQLQGGIYILKIHNKNESYTAKIIFQ